MAAEIPRGALLTTATIRKLGHETPRFRQAGLTEFTSFRNQQPYVNLVAMGIGEKFRTDLHAYIMLDSGGSRGLERWNLDEQPGSLHYRLRCLVGISILGQSLQHGDKLDFHLLRTRSVPGTLSIADLDVSRALTEQDPVKVVEFLASSIALTEAIYAAHALSADAQTKPNRLATA